MSTYQKMSRTEKAAKEQEILSLVLNDGLTHREAAKKSGVEKRTVEYIMTKFAHSTQVPTQMSKKTSSNPTPEDYAALQAEVARLQKELRMEKMRADVNSTMIDVAEEMFHIPIRKKAGTK